MSLATARTFGGRLVARFGEPLETPDGQGDLSHLFPTAGALAEADLEAVGLNRRRAITLRALAKAVCTDEIALDRGADREDCVAALRALPGIGSWTAGYIAMRALGDPDVFLHNDPGLLEAARHLGAAGDPAGLAAYAERWRPWRSYAAINLWTPPARIRTSDESDVRNHIAHAVDDDAICSAGSARDLPTPRTIGP